MAGTPIRTYAELLRASINLGSGGDTLRVALYDDTIAYTFDEDAHEFVGDVLDGVVASEFSGSSGYTGSADRKTLANQSVVEDNVDGEGVFDADDVTWSGVSGTDNIQGWIVYKQVGGDDTTPADDPIILVVDDDMADAPSNLPLDLGSTTADVTISFDAEGLWNLFTQP